MPFINAVVLLSRNTMRKIIETRLRSGVNKDELAALPT
jgi:hypothetical protein